MLQMLAIQKLQQFTELHFFSSSSSSSFFLAGAPARRRQSWPRAPTCPDAMAPGGENTGNNACQCECAVHESSENERGMVFTHQSSLIHWRKAVATTLHTGSAAVLNSCLVDPRFLATNASRGKQHLDLMPDEF